jgi:hypothetical protein
MENKETKLLGGGSVTNIVNHLGGPIRVSWIAIEHSVHIHTIY